MTISRNLSFLADGASSTGVLDAPSGGTGQSSYAVGDLLYSSTTTALSKLADVATGNAVISGGVGVAPSYGKIGLTTHVSGTLPIANGGTGSTTAATVAGTGISVSGTFPNQTVTNSGVTSIVAGTGISISGATGAVTVTNSSSVSATQLCKSWVNFNGQSSGAIRASYNVSSITENSAGDWSINFTTAMADSNYAAVLGSDGIGNNDARGHLLEKSYDGNLYRSTSYIRVIYGYSFTSGITTDGSYISSVAIFG
jgi:hypothetical protein